MTHQTPEDTCRPGKLRTPYSFNMFVGKGFVKCTLGFITLNDRVDSESQQLSKDAGNEFMVVTSRNPEIQRSFLLW